MTYNVPSLTINTTIADCWYSCVWILTCDDECEFEYHLCLLNGLSNTSLFCGVFKFPLLHNYDNQICYGIVFTLQCVAVDLVFVCLKTKLVCVPCCFSAACANKRVHWRTTIRLPCTRATASCRSWCAVTGIKVKQSQNNCTIFTVQVYSLPGYVHTHSIKLTCIFTVLTLKVLD